MQRKVCPGLGSRLAMDFAREKKREGRQRSAWSYLTYLVLYLVDGSVGEYGACGTGYVMRLGEVEERLEAPSGLSRGCHVRAAIPYIQ